MDLKRKSYNERLFKGNFTRRFFHIARFIWIKDIIKKYRINFDSLIELGCFDGKILDFLPYEPKKYIGYDANWEYGLDEARNKFKNDDTKKFIFAETPSDIKLDKLDRFSLGISVETFEHIPPKLVCPYLKKLSEHIDDYLLITVPNEIGIFFLIKKILKPNSEEVIKYSLSDIVNLTLGRTNLVERDNHRGFDYNHLIYDIRKYFYIKEVSGYPRIRFLPKFLSFGVGIVAVPRKS